MNEQVAVEEQSWDELEQEGNRILNDYYIGGDIDEWFAEGVCDVFLVALERDLKKAVGDINGW
jgi:hypothetical protein